LNTYYNEYSITAFACVLVWPFCLLLHVTRWFRYIPLRCTRNRHHCSPCLQPTSHWEPWNEN